MANATRPLAVVTGASRGIGLGLARRLAARGHDLVIGSSGDGIHHAALSLAAFGVCVESVQSDHSTWEGVEALCARVEAWGRPVDVLCLNAGVTVAGSFLEETSLRDELAAIGLNCAAVVHAAKRLVPAMVARGAGRVLITASREAWAVTPWEAVYGATRAFALSFARSLREELAGTGVTVTAMLPGPTRTELGLRAAVDDTPAGARRGAYEDDPGEVAGRGLAAMFAGRA